MQDWFVTIDVDLSEAEDIQAAAAATIPTERYAVITESVDDEERDVWLSLKVAAASESGAFEAAAKAYERCREWANLSDEPARIIGYVQAVEARPQHELLLEEANELVMRGSYAYAAVRAQTACEVIAREALQERLRTLAPDWLVSEAFKAPVSFRNHQQQRLWHAVTGSEVQKQDEWWGRYLKHLKRRHGIVHDGLAVSEADAHASVDVATEFVRYVQLMRSAAANAH